MEVWVKTIPGDSWRRERGALIALERLTEGKEAALLLVADKPDLDLPQLLATLRLMQQLSIDAERIALATASPSAAWLAPLAEGGLKHLILRSKKAPEQPDEGRRVAVAELLHHLCPYLHARTSNGVTLSACGLGHDRIVLADHHLDSWCLHQGHGCPHLADRKRQA
ncbi:MAG: hypothetical protein C4523_06925 [Myxococcales bacterium]|nr:MAG: hypothetical protein C4523_06925 [Myxococcales bacterium]